MSDVAAVDNRNGFPGPGQKRGRHRSFGVSINLTHAKVAREKPPAKPPAPIAPAPVIVQAVALPSIEITGRVLAEIFDYNDLWRSVRDRLDVIGLTRDEVNEQAGLPDRYVAKILGPSQIRKFGNTSLGPTLGATGCYLLLVEDPAATAKMMARAQKRKKARGELKLLPPPRPPAS
jgi:hypothetical protein